MKNKLKGMKSNSLEVILDNLSDEGRANLVWSLVQRGESIPQHHVEKTIDYHIQQSLRLYGHDRSGYIIAELAKAAENIQGTLNKLESKDINYAIRVAQALGLPKKAIELCLKTGKRENAAKIALESQQYDLAIDLYSQESWEKARDLAVEHGRLEKALEISERNEDFKEAIEIAEKQGLKDKIRELKVKRLEYYEREEDFRKAGDLAQELGFHEQARTSWTKALADCLRRAKEDEEYCNAQCRRNDWYDEASQLAVNLGKKRDAFEYKEKSGTAGIRNLAEFAEELGFLKKAMHLFEINEYSQHSAARIAEKLGLLEKSLQLYEGNEYWGEAAKVAKKIGQEEKSQELYRKAIRRAEEEGMTYKSEKAFIRAGELALECGEVDRAISLYKRGKDYNRALEVAKEKGRVELAVEIMSRDQHGLPEAAGFAEENGSKMLATQLYRKALEFYEARLYLYHSGDFERAARIAGKLGNREKEIKYYREAMNAAENEGMWNTAYNIAIRLKEKDKAAIYKSALDFTTKREDTRGER